MTLTVGPIVFTDTLANNEAGSTTLVPPSEAAGLIVLWGGHKSSSFPENLASCSYGGVDVAQPTGGSSGTAGVRSQLRDLLDITGRTGNLLEFQAGPWTPGVIVARWLIPQGTVVREDVGNALNSAAFTLATTVNPAVLIGVSTRDSNNALDSVESPAGATIDQLTPYNNDRSAFVSLADIEAASVDYDIIGSQTNVAALYSDTGGGAKRHQTIIVI